MSNIVDPYSPASQPEPSQAIGSDWPPSHPQGPNGTQPGWATPAPGNPGDGNSIQSQPEPVDEYSFAASGSIPPVIEAFPDGAG